MKAISLKVEYLNNPIGIDIIYPQFFWKCEAGIKQTAYQIIAKSEALCNRLRLIRSKNKWASRRQFYYGTGIYLL